MNDSQERLITAKLFFNLNDAVEEAAAVMKQEYINRCIFLLDFLNEEELVKVTMVNKPLSYRLPDKLFTEISQCCKKNGISLCSKAGCICREFSGSCYYHLLHSS